MACAANSHFNTFINIEDSPEPEVVMIESNQPPMDPAAPVDPRDPEGFLKRCSGFCKKTRLRCNTIIGRKAQQNTHPAFLPTCGAHRDQQSFAGWCQFKQPNGERCARLFRWRPPYFELCEEHQGHPDTPCYFIKQLPLEIRHEIYRYLLPTQPIGSSTADVHRNQQNGPIPPFAHVGSQSGGRFDPSNNAPHPSLPQVMSPLNNLFPIPLLDLLLVSSQIHQEVKDFMFSIVTFKIDVRKDGTFMCGRRLLEPQRADGSSHFLADEADNAKKRFLKTFDWAAVKNYTVDILLENWASAYPHFVPNHITRTVHPAWDEEVEIYDIRDYVSVVVSGILAKSTNLCKLQVRVCLADFQWEQDRILANAKLLVSPFERLRNVRQAHLGGVFEGRPNNNSMYSHAHGNANIVSAPPGTFAICSVPSIPTSNLVLAPGIEPLDTYAANWRRKISSTGSAPMTEDPQIRRMFTDFKDFYTHLSGIVPDVTHRNGRHTFLHKARVAREQEDVISFREIRSELIHYWEMYLAQEEQKKKDMDQRLGKLLSSDLYPSHEWDLISPKQCKSPSGQSAKSPVLLDADTMSRNGIPMTGNPGNPQTLQGRMRLLEPNIGYSPLSLQQQRVQQQMALQAQQRHRTLVQQEVNQQGNTQPTAALHTYNLQLQYQQHEHQQQRAQKLHNLHTQQANLQQQTMIAQAQPHNRHEVQKQYDPPLHHIALVENKHRNAVYGERGALSVKQQSDNDDLYSDPFHKPSQTQDASSVDCVFPDLLKNHQYDRAIPNFPPVTICGSSSVSANATLPIPHSDPRASVWRGEPGPSTKRRRIDSGYEEGIATAHAEPIKSEEHNRNESVVNWGVQHTNVPIGGTKGSYTGKGKGKMYTDAEAISSD